MGFQSDPERIVWRIHLESPPDAVYEALDSDAGRASFWAESAVEHDGVISFEFINGVNYQGRVVGRKAPHRWSVDYFGSIAEFVLKSDGRGGTDLTLINTGVAAADRVEVTAGWLNVLFPLKAAIDFGIDLRTHDPTRTWQEGFVDQ